MDAYVVSFFNELSNDTGHAKKVLQGHVVIRRARSRERALQAAKMRFARDQRVGRWDLTARDLEIRLVGEGERLA
jgi:hypothetical protein